MRDRLGNKRTAPNVVFSRKRQLLHRPPATGTLKHMKIPSYCWKPESSVIVVRREIPETLVVSYEHSLCSV